MSLAEETASWDQLGDKHYRKREIYQLEWQPIPKFDLAKFSIAAAPHGGALALTLDAHKLINVASSGIGVDQIHVYSSSAVRLAAFTPKKSMGRLVCVGWSDVEELVHVLDDGTVQLYTVLGQLLKEFSLGGVCASRGVAACRVYGRGLVALSNSNEFVWLASFDEPRPRVLANANLGEPPTAWEVVDPRHTPSSHVEVLVATATGTIVVLDGELAQDQLLANGPFDRLSVAPGGKFVASFSAHTQQLWVTSIDFKQSIVTFDTKSARVPTQLVWCGADSVVMSWPELLLMVGPGGEWIKYTYEEQPVFLAPELDGVRVFSNTACEFLQRVPDAVEQIFKIGSTAPSSMLFDATEHFYRNSPKADELIRVIGAELADAVDACIEAAGHERAPSAQRALLRAASFGKAFVDNYDPDKLVKMCKALRVLNALAHHEIGVPMTHAQLRAIGSRGAVARLTARHMHLLALRVAKHLGQRPDAVLVHWACEKVRAPHGKPDAVLGEEIVAKLSQVPGVSYVEVASTAHRLGRVELATLLLEHEPHAADQVPLLIGMGEAELALRKAIASGDTDLVYLVLLHIKRTATPQAFFGVLKDKPVAMALLIAYCVPEEHEILTSRGFLDLDAYKAAAVADPTLLVASYDVATKALVFEKPNKLVQFEADTRQLVELSDADEMLHGCWSADSDSHGIAQRERNARRSNGVSMLVTKEHDVFAQLGNAVVDKNGTLTLDGAKQQATGPHAKLKAGELLKSDTKFNTVRQLAVAEAGVRDENAPDFCDELGLHTREQRALFYELYGFWLADGTLRWLGELRQFVVVFSRVKEADIAWLETTLQTLAIPHIKSGQSREGDRVTIAIESDAWNRVFAAEYKHKYLAAGVDESADEGFDDESVDDDDDEDADDESVFDESANDERANDDDDDDDAFAKRAKTDAVDALSNLTQFADATDCRTATALHLQRVRDAVELTNDAIVAPPARAAAVAPLDAEGRAFDTVSSASGSYMQPEGINKSAKWFAHWVWRLGAASLRRVLAGLQRAGGASSKNRRICTTSARFRDEIQRVCLLAGYTAHFRCAYKAGAQRGVVQGELVVATVSSWAVYFAESDGSLAGEKASKPSLFKARGEIREREYTGRVWCFNMPSGFIWVRRVAKDERGVVSKASRPLLTGNCKEQDLTLLQDIYFALSRAADSAHVKVREAYTRADLTERVAGLQGALEVYRDAKDTFHAQATEDQIRLLLLQREAEAETGRQFVGKSLGDTLYELYALADQAQHKRAAKLAKEFKVPDKRLWYTRLAAAVAARDWDGLATLAKEKKSPIGYAPFAEACIGANAPEEARKYIARIAELDERVELYCRIKAYRDAATTAREAKSVPHLQQIRELIPNDRQTQAVIESFLNELNAS